MNIQKGLTAKSVDHDAFYQRGFVSKEATRLRLSLSLMFSDAVCIIAGALIGHMLRFGTVFSMAGLNLAAVLLPIFLCLALSGLAYGAEVLGNWRKGVSPALLALFASAAAVLFVSYWLKASENVSRLMFADAIASCGLLLVVSRAAMHFHHRRTLGSTPLTKVLICDGMTLAAPEGVHKFEAGEIGLIPDMTDPMMLDRLGRFLKGVDSVVIACPHHRRGEWAMALKGANIEGELLMPEIAAIGGIGTARFNGETTLVVATGPLGTRSRATKRLFDLSLGLAAILFFGPLMLLTALAIRIDDDGPVFFVQNRLGRGNRLFGVYKFRSMRIEQCDANGNRSAARDDDRITRVGRFIRATSLDELPQILNILKGDMSFVGPRPHALGSLAGDQLFWEIDQRYWHRHAAKPGLTGLAQVRGFRGATHQRVDLVNRLQADLEYLSGWSIWRDFRILCATLRVVVHKNAF